MGKLIGNLAAGVGHALRFAIIVAPILIRLAGLGLIVWGVYRIHVESGLIVAGAILASLFVLPRKESK